MDRSQGIETAAVSRVNPLRFQDLGVPEGDSSLFIQEARDWLGLVIDPFDIRQSTIGKITNKDFMADKTKPRWLERYHLMMRIYLATLVEDVFRKNLLDKNMLDELGRLLTTSTLDKDKLELIKSFDRKITDLVRYDKVSESPKNLLDIEKDSRSPNPFDPDDPTTFYHNTLNNVAHDLMSFAALRNYLSVIIEGIGKQGHEEYIKIGIAEINKLLQGGNLYHSSYFMLRGYQDELVTGWVERRCNPVAVLRSTCQANACRFDLSFSETRDVTTGQERPEQEEGGIILDVSSDVDQELQISSGTIYRIFNNLVKNTTKAQEQINGKESLKSLRIKIKARLVKGNLIITMHDNGPGFDLNVPISALAKLARQDPSILNDIGKEIDPQAEKMLREYLEEKYPFAIYPLTLEQLFQLFLYRRISGKIVTDVEPDNVTSGIGLYSVNQMVVNAYGGEIRVTNHPDGGAFVLIGFPLEKEAAAIRDDILPKIKD